MSAMQIDNYCFAYHTSGELCFICEDEGSPRGSIQAQHRCQLCPLFTLSAKPPAKLVEHMGMHILHDPMVKLVADNPCGFCCSTGPGCVVRLKKGKGRGGNLQIDVSNSRCINGNVVKISLASAGRSTAPRCSNIPVICPLCPDGFPAIWKYNLPTHIAGAHETARLENFKKLCHIEPVEVGALKNLWRRPRRPSARVIRDLGGAIISEAHSARLALRYVRLDDHHNALTYLTILDTPPTTRTSLITSRIQLLMAIAAVNHQLYYLRGRRPACPTHLLQSQQAAPMHRLHLPCLTQQSSLTLWQRQWNPKLLQQIQTMHQHRLPQDAPSAHALQLKDTTTSTRLLRQSSVMIPTARSRLRHNQQ